MGGYMAGCRERFSNRQSRVSATYGIGLGGTIDQYVALEDCAWANGILELGNRWDEMYDGPWGGDQENPNRWTLSVETEDLNNPSQAVTDELYGSTLAVCRLMLKRYPNIPYLTSHHVISPRSRPNCCGDRWIASGRFAQLADALGLEAVL